MRSIKIYNVLGVVISLSEGHNWQILSQQEKEVSFFFHPQCPHCRKQKVFNPYLQTKYPEVAWKSYDTSYPENAKILADFVAESGRPATDIAVPMTFIGPYVISGFHSPETTGIRLEKAILAFVRNDPTLFPEEERSGKSRDTMRLPLLGEIRLADY